jgi:hypothetical protein
MFCSCSNTTCCRLVLFIVFLFVSIFYALERRQDVWFDDQFYSVHGDTNTEMYETNEGTHVPLPIIYLDGSLAGAFYLVDPIVASKMLPKSMEPLLLPWPISKAIAGIFMFEYRNTSIGSYGETRLTIQAKEKNSHASLLHYACDMLSNVYHLPSLISLCGGEQITTGLYAVTSPVTTSSAKAAGKEIWGYNKYVANMKSNFLNADVMTFDVNSEFTYELDSLGGSYLPSFTMAGLPFLTYTEHDHQIMRTIVNVGHKLKWGGSTKLKITGKGPTSSRMKKLKLNQLAPIAVFRTDRLKAHLPRGKYVRAEKDEEESESKEL